jgi:inactive STAND/TIR domain
MINEHNIINEGVNGPVDIFCFYAVENERFKRDLYNNLSGLVRGGYIRLWNNHDIPPGAESSKEINERLNSSKIILLLITADFIGSEDCYKDEIKRAIKRHKDGDVRVIPVLLSPVIMTGLPFSEFRPLPFNKTPVEKWSLQSEAYAEIAQSIEQIVNEVTAGRIVEPEELANPEVLKPEPPASGKPSFLVALLCDRSEQKKSLNTVLREQKRRIALTQRQIPVVCVIHGATDESLDGFEQRLKANDFYDLLDLDRTKYPVRRIPLPWPTSDDEKQDPHSFFRESLAGSELGDTASSVEIIFKHLGTYGAPIMISSELSTERWNSDTPELIKSYLEFWDKLPKVESTLPLIACLFFSYEKPGRGDEDAHLAYEQSNQEARALFSSLDVAAYSNMLGLVLKELQPVKKFEVLDWINDKKSFKDFCRLHSPEFCNPAEVIKMRGEIRTLYSNPQLPIVDKSPVISMHLLAKRLSAYLDRHRCEAGRAPLKAVEQLRILNK